MLTVGNMHHSFKHRGVYAVVSDRGPIQNVGQVERGRYESQAATPRVDSP